MNGLLCLIYSQSTCTICSFQTETLHEEVDEADIVKAIPISKKHPHGHFDTVIVMENDDAEATGLAGKVQLLMSNV